MLKPTRGKNLRGTLSFAALVLVAAASAFSSAHAGTVNCPQPPQTRVFTLTSTPTASCAFAGDGNINGNASDPIVLAGYVFLDKSDSSDGAANGAITILTGTGTSGPGNWTIVPPAGYTDLVFALKSGENVSPTWAAFFLNGATTGTWSLSENGLSHANLYGHRCDGPCPNPGPSPVPLPS